MKWLNELLGFVVLTSPLWLVLILLPVSIWIAVKIAKRFTNRTAKIAVGIGVFLLVFLVPFADEIAGRIYFNHLCATKAGVKVYQTVELPGEYWDADGKPKFLNPRGVLIGEAMGDRFEWRNVDEPYVDSVIKIEKWRWELVDKKTRAVLGEKITYMRRFGWIVRFSPAPNIGEGCRNIWAKRHGRDRLFQKEDSENKNFLLRIFIPRESSKIGDGS